MVAQPTDCPKTTNKMKIQKKHTKFVRRNEGETKQLHFLMGS
jgi:hypothetical protein